jgi:hypothetical protein
MFVCRQREGGKSKEWKLIAVISTTLKPMGVTSARDRVKLHTTSDAVLFLLLLELYQCACFLHFDQSHNLSFWHRNALMHGRGYTC